jgi:hypothetical protein
LIDRANIVGHDGCCSRQPYPNNPYKRIPIPITNAEIPANKNADDSACFKRIGLVRINASRRSPWNARTISRIPITNRVEVKIYFHMLIVYLQRNQNS